jgi:hypothetical protein
VSRIVEVLKVPSRLALVVGSVVVGLVIVETQDDGLLTNLALYPLLVIIASAMGWPLRGERRDDSHSE